MTRLLGLVRWDDLWPRLLVLLGVFLVLLGFRDLLLKSLVTVVGQRILGSQVDVARVETAFRQATISLTEVQVADRRHLDRNLLSWDEATLQIDSWQLSLGKFVVVDGQINGLCLGGPRSEKAVSRPLLVEAFDPPSLPGLGLSRGPADPLTDTLWAAGQSALTAAKTQLQEEIRGTELESAAVSQQVYQHWLRQFQLWQDRIEAYGHRAKSLTQQIPSRGDFADRVATARQIAQQAEALVGDLTLDRRRISALPQALQNDLQAVQQAATRDLQRARERLQANQLTAEQVTDSLFGEPFADHVQMVVHALRELHRFLRSDEQEDPSTSPRGRLIALQEQHPTPEILIRRASISGQGELNKRPFRYRGLVQNWSNKPQWVSQPLTVTLQLETAARFQVRIEVDSAAEEPIFTVHIRCQRWPVSAGHWGHPQDLSLHWPEGHARVELMVTVQGEKLQGTLHWWQPMEGLHLQLGSPSASSGSFGAARPIPLSELLEQPSGPIVSVALQGTLEDPDWSLRSPLAEKLSGRLNDLLAEEVDMIRQELAGQIRNQTAGYLAGLRQALEPGPALLLSRLQQQANLLQGTSLLWAQQTPSLPTLPQNLPNMPQNLPNMPQNLPNMPEGIRNLPQWIR